MAAMALCFWASCTHSPQQSQSAAEQDSMMVEAVDTVPLDTLSEHEERVEELSLPPQHTEAFSDFFYSFLNNRRFQAERVKFPLSVCDIEGNESVIKSGRAFRAYFTWPSLEEYCLLLNDEAQMDDLLNSLELQDVEVQLIELRSGEIRAFYFHRADKQWQLTHSREYMAEGNVLDFLHFYDRFSVDTLFQEHSLSGTIRYTMSDPDDEYSQIEGTLDAAQWSVFHPELPVHRITNILFGQQLEQTNEIVFMHCGIGNGLMEAFTFRNNGGKWRLISFQN